MKSLLLVVLPLLHLASAKLPSLPISQLRQSSSSDALAKRDINPSLLYATYNLSVPVDHFHNESKYEPHSNATFPLRYWFDATYYQPGGPVIVLESGETSAVGRLPFLQKGIIHQLAKATGGVGVILEHRYYGASMPTPDLSTANLRFLTTAQALADTAFFAQNVVFPGLEHLDLTSHATPWIAYGGSYAGAFVAFLRTLYPDVFWGAVSSSGVTEAIYDYWQYYSPIAEYAPQDCVRLTQQLTHVVDEILIARNGTPLVAELKEAFQMSGITHDDDFANAIAAGVGSWQGRNWDPALNDPTFFEYCGNLTAATVQYPFSAELSSAVQDLLEAADGPSWAGWGRHGGLHGPPGSPGSGDWASRGPQSYGPPADKGNLTIAMLNYIGWLNSTAVQPCIQRGQTLDQCFSTHNTTFYAQDDITQTWRSWPYQYCTQWGYLQTGSGVPASQLPLISRTIDLAYESIICVDAFNITSPPDTAAINALGGFGISYPRLAIVGGQADPWRPATPLADGAPARVSSPDQPVILIEGAVHHWDENGLLPNQTTASLPPMPVAQAQMEEVAFVLAWMEEARASFVPSR